MRIVGEWQLCDDGVTRPTVRAKVLGRNSILIADDFLIDTGADRTVFSAGLLTRLGLPARSAQPDFTLNGIGGTSAFVCVTTVVEFVRDDGGPARVHGEFAGFIDPTATDLSVLGRDVLNHFDLIISRRQNEIFLLTPRHQYHIERDG
jgi:aspartyl protease